MSTTHLDMSERPCTSLVAVIEDVLAQIQSETEAPMSLADVDVKNRHFLESISVKLIRARRLAAQAA